MNLKNIFNGSIKKYIFLCFVITLVIIGLIVKNYYLSVGCIIYGLVLISFYAFRKPSMWIIRPNIDEINIGKHRICYFITLVITILVCVLPMGLCPIWNGEIPEHRNQYEVFADSIIDGHLDLQYDDNSAEQLQMMKNPYDTEVLKSKNIDYHWDHAFFNGKYYMYFGVVPAILLFVPYKLITNSPLTTYHATQIFVALSIIGIFSLIKMLAKEYFKNMKIGVMLALSVSLSSMSVCYCAGTPALYCTAISAGICFEIWSIFLFTRAVYIENNFKKEIVLALFGSLCGALTFGCRPTIALANIIIIPMLNRYISKRKDIKHLWLYLIVAALPYILIAGCLMAYNYVRFENPFEFGQAYQLTVTDQSGYSILNRIDEISLYGIVKQTIFSFIGPWNFTSNYPFLKSYLGGMLVNFPILWLSFAILNKKVRCSINKDKMIGVLSH